MYAPFCRYLFVENDFTDATVKVLQITPRNVARLRGKYEVRNKNKLPVLVPFFPKELLASKNIPIPEAKIWYCIRAHELLHLESATQPTGEEGTQIDSERKQAPLACVTIFDQDFDRALPMNNIAFLPYAWGEDNVQNRLISLIHFHVTAYMESLEYWKIHAVVSYRSDNNDAYTNQQQTSKQTTCKIESAKSQHLARFKVMNVFSFTWIP